MTFVPAQWTDARVEELKRLWDTGASARKIADTMGGISRNGVLGKAMRLKLTRRDHGGPRVSHPRSPTPPRPPTAARQELPEPEALEVDGRRVTMLTVRNGMCRWPIGDPTEEAFHFCANSCGLKVYCPAHAKKASAGVYNPRKHHVE